MLRKIALDAESDTPLYRQLYDSLRQRILRGDLALGDRLPPTRELAGQLGLNRTTVSAAYALLEQEGLIRGHVGRGSFVSFRRPGGASATGGMISFASSRPAADQFPLADFQQCCREVVHGDDAAAILQLGSPAGYPPLRHFLLDASRAEGTARSGDDVVVTNGCQQALDLIARVLAPPGSAVLLEEPVYHGLKNAFARVPVKLAGVRDGQSGFDVEQFARAVATERPRIAVVTPNFQNPTGGTLPIESRRALLRIAEEAGLTLVENDIYGELRYAGEPLPALKQMDEGGRVLLIRSFSKIAFPGLRVGWVIGPSKVVSALAAARQWCDLHTDQLSQAVLWRFAASGRLAEHLERVRELGAERLRAVLAACERYLPQGTEWTRPEGGMSLWVRLPEGVDTEALLPRAEREGVTYLPGRHFAVTQPEPNALRLSFGGLPPAVIDAGVAVLGRVFGDELDTKVLSDRLDSALALV